MNPFIPIEVTNGLPPYEFFISTGTALPAGLTFNTSTGFISGVPTQLANLVDYDITVLDANTTTSTASFRLIVQSEILPYLERIAVAVENISTVSTTTGIRNYGAYDWIKPLEMISWYGQGLGLENVSTTSTNQLISIINGLTNSVSKFE